MDTWPLSNSRENVPSSTMNKRMRISKGEEDLSNTANPMTVNDKVKHSDQFSAADVPERLNTREYGSVTGILEDLISLEKQLLQPRFLASPALSSFYLKSRKNKNCAAYKANLEDETHGGSAARVKQIIIIDSDDEDPDQMSLPIFGALLPKFDEENDINDIAMAQPTECSVQLNEVNRQAAEIQLTKSTGVYAMVQEEDQKIEKEDDRPDDMVAQTSESSVLRSMVNCQAAETKSPRNQNNAAYKLTILEDETNGGSTATVDPVIVIDSDEDTDQRSLPFFGTLLPKSDNENDINDIAMAQTSEGSVQINEVNRQAAEIQLTKSTGLCAMVQEEDQGIENEDDCPDDMVAQTSEMSVLGSMENGRAAEITSPKNRNNVAYKLTILEDEMNGGSTARVDPVIVIDSDDEDPDQRSLPIFGTLQQKSDEENDINDIATVETSEGSAQRKEVNRQAAEIQFTKSTGVCAIVQEEDQRIEKEDGCLVDMATKTSESCVIRSMENGGAAEIKVEQTSKSSVQRNEVNGEAAESKGVCDIVQEEDQRTEKEDNHLDDIVTQTSDNSVLRSMVNVRAAEIKIARTSESRVQIGQASEYQCPKSKGVCAIVQEEQRIEQEDDHLDDIFAHNLDCSVLRSMVSGRAAEKEDDCLHTIATHIADDSVQRSEVNFPDAEIQVSKDKGIYVGVEEDDQQSEKEDDCLNDLWREMNMAQEYSKEVNDEEPSHDDHTAEVGDCDHSFILKDDIGYVCRICGIIDQGIDTIFEFQYNKGKRNTRTYMYEPRYSKDKGFFEFARVKYAGDDLITTEISAHPRHMKQMKHHQVEGFKFLASNLVADSPGGCIMAHAPGSGKTFMIISFVQSFLGKYPQAKPLVILPKGILGTWKKEFQTWQVENLLLLDFYSVKADNRKQQFEVLKQWVEERSILFLGYKQFSSIVCDSGTDISSACQEMLLKVPTILILDEGHTPRNQDTDVLQSLARVQTPRKVVLSGTLYQNHVKEVFNILNLVRPKFLKLETSRVVYKRIMSRVDIAGIRKHISSSAETAFYDLVEHTLQNDEEFKRKVAVIKDLREMTSTVLHYYKGDSLEELPGLVDFTVVLNLSPRQKEKVDKLKKQEKKFKMNSIGSSLYLHPELISHPETLNATNAKIDKILEHLDLRDGAKANFFLKLLNLCVSADEKLLVFSQYLLPLKFLERLVVKTKSWSLGREIFVITGDSSSEHREWSMEQFNSSPDAKVFLGSIKACGEGISLVGASRIIILDVHLNPSVTRQAIGRAFRPGQTKMVYVYRLVANGSPEEEDHATCFRKELISKLWFEWNEYCGFHDFMVETSSVETCGDLFLESPSMREGIISLYKR